MNVPQSRAEFDALLPVWREEDASVSPTKALAGAAALLAGVLKDCEADYSSRREEGKLSPEDEVG